MGTKRDISERKLRNKNEDVSGTGEQTWIVRECAECHFKDVRLQKRLGMLLEQMSGGVGESIPFVCQDWANTKAAYRFFSNERVSEEEILRGHFRSTQERLALESDPILILHDTTEFSYTREETPLLGFSIARPPGTMSKGGRGFIPTVEY
jgi:hypothetical protein